jgi:hypothetical protein
MWVTLGIASRWSGPGKTSMLRHHLANVARVAEVYQGDYGRC